MKCGVWLPFIIFCFVLFVRYFSLSFSLSLSFCLSFLFPCAHRNERKTTTLKCKITIVKYTQVKTRQPKRQSEHNAYCQWKRRTQTNILLGAYICSHQSKDRCYNWCALKMRANIVIYVHISLKHKQKVLLIMIMIMLRWFDECAASSAHLLPSHTTLWPLSHTCRLSFAVCVEHFSTRSKSMLASHYNIQHTHAHTFNKMHEILRHLKLYE